MLKDKFIRHTLAFLMISVASILLYPFAQAWLVMFIWPCLGIVILAAILTLTTK